MKNILVLNSRYDKNQLILDFFNCLKDNNSQGYDYYLLSHNSEMIDRFKDFGWHYNKIYFGPVLEKKINLLFIILLPFLTFFHIFVFLFYKYKHSINTVVCLELNEKIFYGIIRKLFKFNVIWVERPEINYREINRGLIKAIRFLSKNAKIITNAKYRGIQLESLGFDASNIYLIGPGIKLKKINKHQDNIFAEIAKHENINFSRKYFTIGAITDFRHPNQIENLLKAVKICLSVIPNVQLIIIGDGENKKNIVWTAKKIEIDNLTWFIGWQENLKKWFDTFDIYVSVSELPNLTDYKLVLKAMASQAAVFGFFDKGYDDVLNKSSGVLCEANDNELLAQEIIKLYRDKSLIRKLGNNARQEVENNFDIFVQAEKFSQLL